MTLELRPTTLRAANRFISIHHRHNRPVQGWIVGVGLWQEGAQVGVGILGRPVARNMADGETAEITRVCSTGTPNVCSKLYGALSRAAFALGYRHIITYKLVEEPGTSLLAAGFEKEADVADKAWDRLSRPRLTCDLFGETITPTGAKERWGRRAA